MNSGGFSVGAACCAAAAAIFLANVCGGAAPGQPPPFEVRVEAEETVCHPPAYEVTNNGSGMFWGFGSTQIVRAGGKLFVSAFEHVPGAAPLNNARWALYASVSFPRVLRLGTARSRPYSANRAKMRTIV